MTTMKKKKRKQINKSGCKFTVNWMLRPVGIKSGRFHCARQSKKFLMMKYIYTFLHLNCISKREMSVVKWLWRCLTVIYMRVVLRPGCATAWCGAVIRKTVFEADRCSFQLGAHLLKYTPYTYIVLVSGKWLTQVSTQGLASTRNARTKLKIRYYN